MESSHLIMVDKIEPWHDVEEDLGVSRVAGSDSLHIRGQDRLSVQRFFSLDLLYHLFHIHVYFPLVLGPTPEAHCRHQLAEY